MNTHRCVGLVCCLPCFTPNVNTQTHEHIHTQSWDAKALQSVAATEGQNAHGSMHVHQQTTPGHTSADMPMHTQTEAARQLTGAATPFSPASGTLNPQSTVSSQHPMLPTHAHNTKGRQSAFRSSSHSGHLHRCAPPKSHTPHSPIMSASSSSLSPSSSLSSSSLLLSSLPAAGAAAGPLAAGSAAPLLAGTTCSNAQRSTAQRQAQGQAPAQQAYRR